MPVMTKSPSGEEIVILSRAEYDELLAAATDEDSRDAIIAKGLLGRLEHGREMLLSEDEVNALLKSPTPLAFWRKKRGLSQAALAKAAGIAQGFVSEIESGKKTGDVTVLKRIAEVLQITLDDLVG